MDLLLHLVKQQEVDIHEVSLASILTGYLKHLEVLRALDLADIGDFVVMASTLMEIKSQELLPNETVELEEELDPRDDLIRRLLEYKRYRDISRRLERMFRRRGEMVPLHLGMPRDLADQEDGTELDMGDLGIWDLTEAFAKLLDEIGQQGTLHVEMEKRGVAFYTGVLLEKLKQRSEIEFEDAFDRGEGRYGLIGVLMAVLEMMKQGFLRAHQEGRGTIHLTYLGKAETTVDDVLGSRDEFPEESLAEELTPE